MTSAFLQPLGAAPDARVRLFAFASAGSGASSFRPWLAHLPPWIELVAIQPPGRENRGREPVFRDLRSLVAALAAELAPVWAERPFAFFGHSLGGRVAFELARLLEAGGGPTPSRVILAASMEPSTLSELDRRCHLLPDAEFEAYVALFGGFPEELRRFPRQFRAVMDLLRADLQLFATADFPTDPPLRAPLAVLGGTHDVAAARPVLEPWAARAAGGFSLDWFDGGHFFPLERAAEVVGRVAALVESSLEST